ncbi:TetR/AcrR family transcriptional regulator [Alcanivorax sp.]|jgi:TetR/AcrR family transcriptional repressor of nem operon|uniref:TetR/AcrR family transcriptional regulator n=1 Tax=Alcanivorax sp. TaxID=1872427 RepID=UPI000C69D5A3|nr:TetR/AcrR family transcriptional regulator [Alcanivorax sp.]MBQ24844.1 TetR family transcriptional regulator [Alcanivorax sp.]|tara:strand:- start:2280 stop:2861 length:582 start_codon:yes stop_codon:yes gene_type:complete
MARKKSFNKDDVLERAMNLFWKQGFHATSMQDIVQNVGLSRSSLYESFGSKQGLFDQALGNYCRTNREGVKALLSNEKSVKTGIRNLLESSIHCTISDADKKGCFVVNSTTELVPGDDEMLKALSKNRASFEKVFFEFLQKGQATGEIPPNKDIKTLSGLIYTVFSGLNVIAKLEKSPKKLMAQIDQIVGLLD